MESYSVIIGLVFIALFILPIWYFQRSQNNSERYLSKLFKQVASTNELSISQSDEWHNMYSIGFDEKHNKLLYLKHSSSGDQKQVIDLSTIAKCSIEKKVRNVSNGKHQSREVDNIKLVLTRQDAAHTQLALEFYDKAESALLNGELTLVEKWKNLIESKLAAKKV
jgi:hypothetical protein